MNTSTLLQSQDPWRPGMAPQRLALALRLARHSEGLERQQMAADMGLTTQKYTRWENGSGPAALNEIEWALNKVGLRITFTPLIPLDPRPEPAPEPWDGAYGMPYRGEEWWRDLDGPAIDPATGPRRLHSVGSEPPSPEGPYGPFDPYGPYTPYPQDPDPGPGSGGPDRPDTGPDRWEFRTLPRAA